MYVYMYVCLYVWGHIVDFFAQLLFHLIYGEHFSLLVKYFISWFLMVGYMYYSIEQKAIFNLVNIFL